MKKEITYFEKPGKDNTDTVLNLVENTIKETKIKKIILASTYGNTAKLVMQKFKGTNIQLIIIPHQFGFREKRNFPVEIEKEAQKEGHIVHYGTMLFHTDKLYGNNVPHLIGDFLRCFCQGVKVCVEMLLMAGNAGLVDIGEQVIVIAGTGTGADTAMLMTGATTMNFQQMHISEILCKPL